MTFEREEELIHRALEHAGFGEHEAAELIRELAMALRENVAAQKLYLAQEKFMLRDMEELRRRGHIDEPC